MEKLRVGIIGCGGIANGKHMPALRSQADKADMVAFCDIVVERAEKAAKEFGAPGAKVYENYRELLEDGSIDANYFQHLPYLEDFNAQQGTHLVSVAGIHVEPMGLYGGKQTTLDAVSGK